MAVSVRKKRRKKDIKRSIERTKWMLNIASSVEGQKGIDTERKVFKALEYHRKRGTVFHGQRLITKVQPTVHFSEDDREQVDIFATFSIKGRSKTEILPLQVKTTWKPKSRWHQNAEERFKKRGICLIAVGHDQDERQARAIVLERINNFLIGRGVGVLSLSDEDISKIAVGIMEKVWRRYRGKFRRILNPKKPKDV